MAHGISGFCSTAYGYSQKKQIEKKWKSNKKK